MHKFRILVIPLLVLVAGATLLVAGTPFLHEHVFPAYAAQLNAARTAIDGELSRDAGELANVVAAAAGADVLRTAARSGVSDETKAAVTAALLPSAGGGPGNPVERKAVFGLLLDGNGTVIASAGAPPPLGNKLAGLPIFAEAKLGTVRDGYLSTPTADLHLAAAPLLTEKGTVFVVLCGFGFDAAYVDGMAKRVGAPTVLMTGTPRKAIGTSAPAIEPATLATLVAETSFGVLETDLLVPIPGVPWLVPEGGRYLAGSVPAFRGQVNPAFAAVIDRQPAFAFLGNAQIVFIGAAILLAILVFILTNSVYGAIQRPINLISEHLSQAAQGGQVGILPEAALSGPFERIGRQVNMILQNPAPGRSSTGPISPISPPSSGAQDDASMPSGFAPGLSEDAATPEVGGAASPPGEAPVSAHASGPLAPLTDAPVSEDLQNSSLSGLFDDGADDPLAAFRVAGSAAPAAPPVAAPPPAVSTPPANLPGGLSTAAPSKEEFQPEATVAFKVPDELLQESSAQAPVSPGFGPGGAPPNTDAFPGPGQDYQSEDSQDRTVVAQIPSELLEQAAPKPEVDGDEVHYREVYDEFIETRTRCGEDISQLTYDRFVAKLMKNRAQIMSKYNSKSVRFQVYVKQNKAALRAVPVRD